MPMTTTELFEFLDSISVRPTTVEHEQVRTVEESKALRGAIRGLHTKNLFLRDAKRRYFLVVANEDTRINLKSLASRIGASGRFSFASSQALMDILGVEPGAVSLLALVNDQQNQTTIVLDESLLNASTINCHPLSSRFTTSLTNDDVVQFLRAINRTPVYLDCRGLE
ncbi:MAG: prolyl-tRNA synthetase associated domain-containing protein [Bradyrhizobiaceae bacterium]|nr:MAG: prolyl-tRNA synthetase associated domain-containing protein [Bradyrhizobiaceae bacterium]